MPHTSNPSLRYSIYDGIAWAIMIGCGEAFFSAYAIFLLANPNQIAVLAAFPAIIPAAAQLLGVKLINYLPNRKSLIVLASFFHALSLLPLALIAVMLYPEFTKSNAAYLLIFFAAVYFFFAGLGVPAWSSLIGDLVPANSRGAYFGLRNKKIAYASFCALIIAGPILAYFKQISLEAQGFCIIFTIAFLARLVSTYWLSRYEETAQSKSDSDYFSFFDFIKRTAHSNFTKFAWYICLMLFALFICGPFFSVYLLRELQFSYLQFTFLSACLIFSQILTLSHWGQLSDKFGNKAILFAASLGICFAPILWTFSTNFYYLIAVHLFSGFVWAGFNLAASNFLFDAVSPAKRARCAAYQSALNGICTFSGAMLGAYLISHPLLEFSLYYPELGEKPKYYFLMLLSASIRFIIVFIFWKKIKEVREVQSISGKDLILKIINVRNIRG